MLKGCLPLIFVLLLAVHAKNESVSDEPVYRALNGERTSPVYPYQLKTFTINLDLSYEDRWREVMKEMGHKLPELYAWYIEKTNTPEETLNLINHTVLEAYDKEFAAETLAISKLVPLSYQQITIMNFLYDAIAMCTSIIVQDKDDDIYHVRTFDLMIASMLSDMMFHGKYMKNGELLYEAITKLGEVGLITGVKKGSFTFSLNTHMDPSITKDQFWNNIKTTVLNMYNEIKTHYEYSVNKKQGLLKQNKSELRYNPLLIARKAIETVTTYQEFVDVLANTPTFSRVFYIISGIQPGEGVVIEKKGTEAKKTSLNTANGTWYLVQTNYLRNITEPAYDNRVTAASNRLDAIGQNGITKELLWNDIFGKYPLFNNDTVHTTLMQARTGEFKNVMWGFGYETNKEDTVVASV